MVTVYTRDRYRYASLVTACPSLEAATQDPYPHGFPNLDLGCHPILKTFLNIRKKAYSGITTHSLYSIKCLLQGTLC